MEALSAEDCRDALDAGALVITATRRLARAMQADYARATGADSWATPAILPWSAWVQSAFRELRDFGRLETKRAWTIIFRNQYRLARRLAEKGGE